MLFISNTPHDNTLVLEVDSIYTQLVESHSCIAEVVTVDGSLILVGQRLKYSMTPPTNQFNLGAGKYGTAGGIDTT